MCGIAGTFNSPEAAKALPLMLAALEHRGPDAGGVWENSTIPGTALGHRRLSIIDPTEGANQPFVEGGLVLTFNGEIYNYKELRVELEKLGESFRTTSDTEVLIKAWRIWGPACLNRLRGMFAFAMLDERQKRLYLARDPFGIKPLFFARLDDGLVFASEVPAIKRAVPQIGVDYGGLVASLMYSWIPESRSPYKGLSKLPPGHWAEMTPEGEFVTHQYWDHAKDLVGSVVDEPSTQELQDILRASVEAHLVADVPVAMFLSGGLDSSLIAALARSLGASLDAYTIGFRAADSRFEAMPDDLRYARIVADQLGLKLHEIEVAPQVTEMLPRMVSWLGEPIGDPAAINTYLIAAAARDIGTKVLLSGMGADELFGGYRKHYAALLASRYRRLPAAARRLAIEPLVERLPVATKKRGFRYSRWAKRFIEFGSLPEAAGFHRSYTLFGLEQMRSLLSPDLWYFIDELVHEHDAIYAGGPADDQVNRMCYADMQLFMAGLNLAYTDRASMAASVEVRVPYVDREVVSAAFAIPGDRKIVKRSRKVVLKDAARGLLPDEIIDRPKALFSVPLRAWIRGDLSEMVDDVLLDGHLIRNGFLNRDAVAGLIESDRRGAADNSRQIWQLLTLEIWHQQQASAATSSSLAPEGRLT